MVMTDEWSANVEELGDSTYYSEESATFGDRLAAARQAAGLAPEELATRLGVGAEVVEQWEDDRAEPRANRVMMLAGMLNVSVSWLLSGSGDGVTPPELAGRARRGEHPFQITIVVEDEEATRRFYRDALGCDLVSRDETRQTFNFFGHHLAAQLGADAAAARRTVDADGEPSPHFGVILGWNSWRSLIERLRAQGVEFLLEPTIIEVGSSNERGVFFIEDPSGNALSFRSYGDTAG